MANTHLELKMDSYIKNNLRTERYLEYYHEVEKKWKKLSRYSILQDKTKYRLFIRARNIGSETYIKNVQLRVYDNNPNIDFYSDDTYTNKVPNSFSPIYPDVLKPTDGINPGDATPYHTVHFYVKNIPSGYHSYAGVGKYAEIVPQGHYWHSLMAVFD